LIPFQLRLLTLSRSGRSACYHHRWSRFWSSLEEEG